MFRRLLLLIAFCPVSLGASAAQETYPVRPVRLVVPSTPGGGLDFSARVVGARLSTQWQQQVIVDNRSGAAGIIGTDIAAKAPPDGYTLVLVSAEFASMPFLYEKLPYATSDFAPITLLVSSPFVVAAHPSVPLKTFRELLAAAKEKPKQLTCATSGVGTTSHLGVMILEKMAGVQLQHVPFKGAGAAVTGAVSGETNLLMGSTGATMQFLKSGRLRPLAVTSAKRAAALPEVPSIAESGVSGYDVIVWFALLAPAKTPKAIVQKIYGDVRNVLEMPEVRSQFATAAVEPGGMPPAEFEKFFREETKRVQAVIKEAGIRLE